MTVKNWKFKEDAHKNSLASGDLFNDLFDGGYLEPSKFLSDEDQIEEVKQAMNTITSYLEALETNDLLEEC